MSIDRYKENLKAVWDERYSRHIIRTVHQASDDAEGNIKLAELETELFLFPEKELCLRLYNDKNIRKCPPTFMAEFYVHKPVSNYLKDLSKCVALDYGCGSMARYSTSFAKYFKKVLAVDSAPKAIEYAKQFTEKYSNIELIENDGVTVPAADSSVDFIFSTMVFQHVGSKDVQKHLLQECFRAMKPGAIFRGAFWTEEKPDDHCNVYDGTGWSVDGYKKVFEEIGFTVETDTHEYPTLWVTLLKAK